MDGKQRALLAASVAGLIAAGLSAPVRANETASGDGKSPCYGINKCKGTGACGGADHSCAGANACKAQGYLLLEKETCLKIEGGRLTEKPESAS